MRIIGGTFRGRKILTPSRQDVRPTSDRLRERVLNILIHRREDGLHDATVLDVFAGTGAFGFECLSRGAAFVTFVENDSTAASLILRNADQLRVRNRMQLLRLDARKLPAADKAAEIVFADPPYGSGLANDALHNAMEKGWIGAGSVVVVETALEEVVALKPPFRRTDHRRQARSAIHFFTVDAVQPSRH